MATIHDALILMGENRVPALPVVNVNGDHACVGILSTDDLDRVDSTGRRFLLEKLARNMGNEPVQSFMSETVTTIHWESSSGEATPKLLKKGKHHLPVIDNKDQLVGITSSMNTLAEFADSPPV